LEYDLLFHKKQEQQTRHKQTNKTDIKIQKEKKQTKKVLSGANLMKFVLSLAYPVQELACGTIAS